MSTPELTEGICERFANGEHDDDALWNSTPTVQLLSIKKVASSGSTTNDRYRIILSDGKKFLQAMLAMQLNTLVEQNAIVKNSIVTIEKMACNMIQGKQYVATSCPYRLPI